MQQTSEQTALLNEAEVAQLWGVTMSRVAQCRVLGKGPAFVKLPTGEVRYRRSDVDAWLATRVRTRTRLKRVCSKTRPDASRLCTELVRLGRELIELGGRSPQ